jgi:hypothetical protein
LRRDVVEEVIGFSTTDPLSDTWNICKVARYEHFLLGLKRGLQKGRLSGTGRPNQAHISTIVYPYRIAKGGFCHCVALDIGTYRKLVHMVNIRTVTPPKLLQKFGARPLVLVSWIGNEARQDRSDL